LQIIECFKSDKKIYSLEEYDSSLVAIITRTKSIEIFSPSHCETLKNIYSDLLKEETTALAFHPKLDLMAIANKETLYIIEAKQHKILETINTHDGEISLLSFVASAPYLISGTKNGRVIQYRYEGKIHISRLCSFPFNRVGYKTIIKNNYVSTIASNDQYVASSGYGGAVTLVKFNSHAKKITFTASQSRVKSIAFLNEKKIIYANVDGVIFIAHIRKNAAIKKIDTQVKDILKILPLHNTNYALVVSKTTTIMLIDTEKRKIIKNNFLKFDKEISSVLLLNNNELLILFCDNTIKKILLKSQSDLQEYLLKDELPQALQLIEQNPFLSKTKEALKVEKEYNKLSKKALMYLIMSNNKEKLSLLKPFEVIRSKKDDEKKIVQAHKNYQQFYQHFKNKKYALAYALAEQFPALKLTPLYQKMETSYKATFTQAQKKLLNNKLEEAKTLLSPYMTILSKRALIHLLIYQNREFISFIKALAAKDYETVNELIEQEKLLAEIPSYIALKEEHSKELQKIKTCIKEAQIELAEKLLSKVSVTSLFQEELQSLKEQAKKAQELLDAYEKDNFIECYEILDANSELEVMQLAQLLENYWNKLIDQCEIFALNGDIKSVQKKLGELIHVKSRRDKVGDLLRLCFHSKIKNELYKANFESAENFIYSYIDIFGKDSEIKQLMNSYEKASHKTLAITVLQEEYKARDAWSQSEYFSQK